LPAGAERFGARRHPLGPRPRVPRAAAAHPSRRHLRRRRVDTHDLGAESGDAPGDLPLPAPEVEDPRRAGEVLVDQRQELLLVLGIGAVGELLLPPAGVPFPRVRGPIGNSRWLIWVIICAWRRIVRTGTR